MTPPNVPISLSLGRFSKQGQVRIENKGGVRYADLQKQKDNKVSEELFKRFAGSDGILDKNEMMQLMKNLGEAAGNGRLSGREAEKYLKSNYNGVKSEELFNLLKSIDACEDDIESSETDKDDNITIKYKEIEGKQTTSVYNKDGVIQNDIITNCDGTKTENYRYDEDGGRRISKTVQRGAITEEYAINDSGKEILTKATIDKGNGGTEISEYAYRADGTLESDTTTLNDETTVHEYKADGKTLDKKTITEGNEKVIEEYGDDGETVTKNIKQQYGEDGSTIKKTTTAGDITTVEEEYNPATGKFKKTTVTTNNGEKGYTVATTENDLTVTKKYDQGGKLPEDNQIKDGEGDNAKETNIKYDEAGNILSNAKNGETAKATLKRLLGRDPSNDELGEFMLLNKDSIKAYGPKKVECFQVGAEVKLPASMANSSVNADAINVNKKTETDKYIKQRDNAEKAKVEKEARDKGWAGYPLSPEDYLASVDKQTQRSNNWDINFNSWNK
ncbi:MAG: hypothetical protein LBK53_07695 [Heliobacteriaceae bacterium]|jgi:hypothetical protein|nr:hypothetical protein [Heliobacteriaceae bacterium]